MITAKNDTGTASSEMQSAKPKNIFILTLGSRGDVQPYVALGKGFQAAGHNVTVCTSSSFESFITGQGLNYGHMSNDLLDLIGLR